MYLCLHTCSESGGDSFTISNRQGIVCSPTGFSPQQ